MNKYIAEAIGTFALTLVVGLSLAGEFPVSTPILAALTLGLFVYSVGHLSGTHLNPAVTIGAWSIKKISNEDAIAYLIAQFFGAAAALTLISTVATPETLTVTNEIKIGVAEGVGALFFAFGIASVVYGKTPNQLSGIMVGGSLLLGIAFAVLLGSNGLINPAVAMGVKSFNVMYILGPIIGSVVGMQAYKYLRE
ncbi:aquaporin [Candidatus Falkowbacteria bacterium]|nr:MAG: aquaporin [Candidatus Falkowbacteria bacterium]